MAKVFNNFENSKDPYIGCMQQGPRSIVLLTQNGNIQTGPSWSSPIKHLQSTSSHAIITLENGQRCQYEFKTKRETVLPRVQF